MSQATFTVSGKRFNSDYAVISIRELYRITGIDFRQQTIIMRPYDARMVCMDSMVNVDGKDFYLD
jgi:hypothetical protein